MSKLVRNEREITGAVDVAEDVGYNNVSSGLEASNVQEAIDEINSDLSASKVEMVQLPNIITTDSYGLGTYSTNILYDKFCGANLFYNAAVYRTIPTLAIKVDSNNKVELVIKESNIVGNLTYSAVVFKHN